MPNIFLGSDEERKQAARTLLKIIGSSLPRTVIIRGFHSYKLDESSPKLLYDGHSFCSILLYHMDEADTGVH